MGYEFEPLILYFFALWLVCVNFVAYLFEIEYNQFRVKKKKNLSIRLLTLTFNIYRVVWDEHCIH